MKTFKEYLREFRREDAIAQISQLFEHEVYKQIPGTKNSYRKDPGNTNTKVQPHAHVYAKLKGKGNQLYAVNKDGSGHDGSTNTTIPSTHADFFRSLGYEIKPSNVLEHLDAEQLDEDRYAVVLMEDAQP